MRISSRLLLTAVAGTQLAALQAQVTYQLDYGAVSQHINASDNASEARDNWFANEFTALAHGNLITTVDFGVFATTPGSTAEVVLYRVTDPGGDPASGATRVYTQSFTPLTGDGHSSFVQSIALSTPVAFNVGDRFLVSIFIPNVAGDVSPYLLDSSGVATGTYWDRSDPGLFNLDDLSRAKLIDQPIDPGGWAAPPGHVWIRASGSEVPEPAAYATIVAIALLGFGVVRRHVRGLMGLMTVVRRP